METVTHRSGGSRELHESPEICTMSGLGPSTKKWLYLSQAGALRLVQTRIPCGRVVCAEIGETRPMASEPVYLQVAKAAWDWIQQDINVWMRALSDLKTVLWRAI